MKLFYLLSLLSILLVLFMYIYVNNLRFISFYGAEPFTNNPTNNSLFSQYSGNTSILTSMPPTPSVMNLPIPSTGIPDGYYQTSPTAMSLVPFGYTASVDKQSIVPQVQSTIYDASSNAPSLILSNASNNYTTDSSNNITHYDPNNYSITYHNDPQDLSSIYYSDVILNTPDSTYYKPGSRVYDPHSFVPDYEQSSYLSKLTGYYTTSLINDVSFNQNAFSQGSILHEPLDKRKEGFVNNDYFYYKNQNQNR